MACAPRAFGMMTLSSGNSRKVMTFMLRSVLRNSPISARSQTPSATSPVTDKTMRRFRHLKRLEELGFIGREEDGSLRITPFGQKRIHHER